VISYLFNEIQNNKKNMIKPKEEKGIKEEANDKYSKSQESLNEITKNKNNNDSDNNKFENKLLITHSNESKVTTELVDLHSSSSSSTINPSITITDFRDTNTRLPLVARPLPWYNSSSSSSSRAHSVEISQRLQQHTVSITQQHHHPAIDRLRHPIQPHHVAAKNQFTDPSHFEINRNHQAHNQKSTTSSSSSLLQPYDHQSQDHHDEIDDDNEYEYFPIVKTKGGGFYVGDPVSHPSNLNSQKYSQIASKNLTTLRHSANSGLGSDYLPRAAFGTQASTMPRLETYLKGFNTSTTGSTVPPKNYISSAPSSSSSSIGNTGKHYQEIHGDVQYESHSGASDSDSIEEEEEEEEEEDDSEVAKLLLATQQVAENIEYPSRLNSEEGRDSMQLNQVTSSALSVDRNEGKLSKTIAGRRRYRIYVSPYFIITPLKYVLLCVILCYVSYVICSLESEVQVYELVKRLLPHSDTTATEYPTSTHAKPPKLKKSSRRKNRIESVSVFI